MTRWRKTAWWAAAILTACLLLGAYLARALVDQEHIKAALQERAAELWSLDLAIGDLSLRLFPTPALRAKQVTLANPAWTKETHLLAAGEVSARLSLLPLLGGQLVVSRLIVDDLQINLEVTKDGKENWDQLATETPGESETSQLGVAGLTALTALRVRNADITYRVADKARRWRVDKISVHAKPGWRDVQVDAELAHENYPLRLTGKFGDLSEFGTQGAVSQGALTVIWHEAELKMSGTFPLDSRLHGQDLQLRFDADSLNGVLGFLDMRSGNTAAVRASVDLGESKGVIQFRKLNASLGAFSLQGHGELDLSRPRPRLAATLTGNRLDWAQALQDVGQAPLPPKPPTQIFRDNPLAWPLLVALDGNDGRIDLALNSLRLRSGLDVTNVKAQMALGRSGLNIGAFSGQLLGGTVDGSLHLNGHKQRATLAFKANNVSLARGLEDRKKKHTDGKMAMRGYLSSSGNSLKQLAANVNGPLVLRVGPMKIDSPGAQKAESFFHTLAPVFSARDTRHIDLACASARLQFSSGQARAEPILGMRSDASQLLASGDVDLRKESLDVRGRLKARSGVSLGLSMLSDNIRISGKILKPELSLDPDGAPEAIARIGAAIVSGGTSILATALWDAANPKSDPCGTVAATTELKRPAGWPEFPAVAPLKLATN